MKPRARAIVVAATAMMVLPVGSAALAEPNESEGCPRTQVFAVGGRADPTATFFANIPLEPGFALKRVHYSAEFFPVTGRMTYDESIADGIQALTREVNEFHARCGDSDILITGYSMGARVAGDVLHDIGKENWIPEDQVDGVLYSDPRRPGVNGGHGGVETTIPTPVKGITMNGPRGFAGVPVHEICNSNDPACLLANPYTNFLWFANNVQDANRGHTDYRPDPVHQRGDHDTVYEKPKVIPYGPDLPIQVPTPWEMFDGRIPGTGDAAMSQLRKRLDDVLSPEAAERAEQPLFGIL